jgi:hypothetical protein
MGGAIPPTPPYVFMAWYFGRGTALPLPLFLKYTNLHEGQIELQVFS